MQLARQQLVLDPRDPLDVRWAPLELRLELAAADEPERELGRDARRLEDRLEAVQRDQLADEEARERALGAPAGLEDALLRADEAHLDLRARQIPEPGQERRVRLGVRDDHVGGAQRDPVDGGERAGRERTGAEPPPIADERVGERDERVEDEWAAPRERPRERHVGVTGIAHEDGVAGWQRASEPRLSGGEPSRRFRPRAPALPPALPDRYMPLDDLHAGSAQARDHLRVPRIVALVGAEVDDPQERISSTRSSDRSRSAARSSWWLVIISLIRPSEKNCIPTTTSRTPSVSSGRWPIACPVAFKTVR